MDSMTHHITTIARTLSASGALRGVEILSLPRWSFGLHVLLVEDDEADAYLIRRALAKNPAVAEVVLAEDGVEALELIDRRHISPDLAIVDLRMPRKDGLTLLKDLSMRSAAQFPAVVLSSSKSRRDAIRATDRGAVRFVTKPKTEADLSDVLDRIIHDVY